jgi:hypothetical protein
MLRIYTAGMESMGQMLLDNETLTEMDVAWNMCGPAGAASFFRYTEEEYMFSCLTHKNVNSILPEHHSLT